VSALSVDGLYKSFGSGPVLADVDLEVPAGELTAILGPSGSGKTTLLRVLAGFERADAGTVTVDGRIVEGQGRHVPPERRHIGYVPQEGALFPHLHVEANIGFGLPRSGRAERVGELLDMIGLADLAGRYPHELSGGQQQRVALARALATRPAIVLLDEPFSSLDAALRSSVRHDVATVLAEAGTTAILVTHDQDEALSMAAQVGILRAGRFVQFGAPLDVYCQPADPDVARFVGEANLLPGTARAGVVATALGSHRLARAWTDGTELTVLIRPEQVDVRTERAGAGGDWVDGTVSAVEYHGHDTVVAVTVQGAHDRPVHARLPGAPAYGVGADVSVRVTADAVPGWPRRPAP
jgi:iron(III) transport system ATP-binding protein